jgi:hypothetical protein
MPPFVDLMNVLTAMSKYELRDAMLDAKCPAALAELIRSHPALLGECFKVLGDAGDENLAPLVKMTEDIIVAHGFRPSGEWEYECDKATCRPTCLRIWLGKKRTKKNLRVLTLTEDEVTRVQAEMATHPLDV